MDPAVELPDAESVIVNALIPVLTEMYVSWKLPDDPDTFDTLLAAGPIVIVTRVGGSVKYRKIADYAILDFDIYGSTKDVVSAAVKTVRAQSEALKNTVQSGAAIAGTYEETGPSNRPELNPNVYRFGFTHGFVIRPN